MLATDSDRSSMTTTKVRPDGRWADARGGVRVASLAGVVGVVAGVAGRPATVAAGVPSPAAET